MTALDGDLVPILMLHSIADDAHRLDLPFTVRPDQLRRHVEALHDWDARTITVSEYAAARRAGTPLPPRTVILTVDDGYVDTADTLAPLLTDAGFRATVFVTTGTVGTRYRESRMITWRQICDLHESGFEIGAHSHHHIALDIVGPRVAREEMTRSRALLEDALGAPVHAFAYPHGYWTAALTRQAAEAGYLVACAAKDGLSHPDDDLYALTRHVVWRSTTTSELLDAVAGRTTSVCRSARTLPRAAWRLARWSRAVVARELLTAGEQLGPRMATSVRRDLVE